MEHRKTPQTPFDTLICPEHLQFLKLLLPYISTSSQRMLGILIKFQELQHTIQYFRKPHPSLQVQSSPAKDISFKHIAEEFLPYMAPHQSDQLQSIINAFEMMEMFQNLSGSDDLMKSMLSPEQQEMFDFYSNMFSPEAEHAYDNTETSQKEENVYGSMDESSRSEGP